MFYKSEVRRNFVFMKIINNYNLNLSDLLALFYSTVSLHDITKDQKRIAMLNNNEVSFIIESH